MKKVPLGIVSVGVLFLAGSASYAQKGGPPAEKRPQTEQPAKEPGSGKGAPPRQDASTPKTLDKADAAEVQKYSDALTRAGLPADDVKALVSEETQERLVKQQKQPATKASTGGAESGQRPATANAGASSQGLGDYVQTLLHQGLRGRDLAAAIHAEQQRRQGANDHGQGKGEGSGHDSDPADHPGKPDQGASPRSGKAPGSPSSAGKSGHPGGEGQGGHKPVNNASGKGSGHGKGQKP